MQNIERDIQAPHERVQSIWRKGRLPHFSGIVVGDGRMVVMDESVVLTTQGEAHHCVGPVCATSFESFDCLSGRYVEITRMEPSLDLGGHVEAICGEGAMGNEGFVAVLSRGLLLWSAFFTTSNPFYKLQAGQDGKLVAMSTHEVEWRFPLDVPWRVETGGKTA